MAESLQFAFNAGILAPAYRARADQNFYEFGLADADDFFIDARGGAVSRPGTLYHLTFAAGFSRPRLKRFRANSDIDGSDFLLAFGDRKLRIYQDAMLQGGEIPTPYMQEHLHALHFSHCLLYTSPSPRDS